MKQKYLKTFMDWAERFAQNSKAESEKVGAVLVTPKGNPIAAGCNGTKPGYHTNKCELEDGSTDPLVNHAETNCLNKLIGTTMSSEGCYMFITHSPCYGCALDIVDAGVTIVYYRNYYPSRSHGCGLETLYNNRVKVFQI